MASIRQREGRWQARVTRKGYPPEAQTFTTHTEARRWAAQVEAAMDSATYRPSGGTSDMPFHDLLERYALEVSPGKRGGATEVIRIRAIKRARIASYAMRNLTPERVAAFRDERLARVAGGAVIRDLALISSVINHARREWGLPTENPCQRVRKPSTPPGRTRVLAPDEEARLLDELQPRGRRSTWMKPAVLLALETAMRLGELLGLTWENVDLQRQTARLAMTKNGESRLVPLSTGAVRVLEGLPGSRTGRVLHISDAALKAAFRKACVRARIDDLHFHDLRHTAATRLAGKVSNVLELAAITGHRTIRMLQRYVHHDASALAKKLG